MTWTDPATSVKSAPFTRPPFVSEKRRYPLNEPGLMEVPQRRQMRVRIEMSPY